MVLAVLVIGAFFLIRGKKPDVDEIACASAYEQGMKALLNKDIDSARLQLTAANGACQGATRAKATALQSAIADADTASSTCAKSFLLIDSNLEEHKLASARAALYGVPAACAKESEANALRTRLATAATTAQSAQARLRTALDAKELAQAKSAFQQLIDANRENPDLTPLKAEVDQLAAAVAAAAVEPVVTAPPATVAPAPSSEAVPVITLPAPRERMPVRRVEVENAPNPKAEMATAFLHDAETALSQKKFDAARTYVDSARRMDPNNPRLDSMNQQIRERERQVLQQETTIR